MNPSKKVYCFQERQEPDLRLLVVVLRAVIQDNVANLSGLDVLLTAETSGYDLHCP